MATNFLWSWVDFVRHWDGTALVSGTAATKKRAENNWQTFHLNYAVVVLGITMLFRSFGIPAAGAVVFGLMFVPWHACVRLTPAEVEENERIDREEEKREAERLEKLYGPIDKKDS